MDQVSSSNYSVLLGSPISSSDILGDDPTTDVYNSRTGNKVGTIKDKLPNVTSVIDIAPELEKTASKMITDVNSRSQNVINAAGLVARSMANNSNAEGTGNYDVGGFFDWFDKSKNSVMADNIAGIPIVGGNVIYNGKKVTPYAEVSNNLRLHNGIVKVGTIPNGTKRNVGLSPAAAELPNESNKIKNVEIHLHPFSTTISIQFNGPKGPETRTAHGQANWNDASMIPHGHKFRAVIVNETAVHLQLRGRPMITIQRLAE